MDASPPAIVVIDGDTILLKGERLHIMNIDAPELPMTARCDGEGLLALAAKDRLAALLKTGPVTIERHGEEQHGRTLALIRVSGMDVGELLIAANLAVPWEGHRHDWCALKVLAPRDQSEER
jgi:endonuclease YncB( thermonuclease family)